MVKIAAALQDNLVQLCIHSYRFFGKLNKLIINAGKPKSPVTIEDIMNIRILDLLSILPIENWPDPHSETTIQKTLRDQLGLTVFSTQFEILTNPSTYPLQVKCTFPNCKKAFTSFNEYVSHYTDTHERLPGLGFFWNDIITWTRYKGGKSTLRDIFSDHYIYRIYKNPDEEYIGFDDEIFDKMIEMNMEILIKRELCIPTLTLSEEHGLNSILISKKLTIVIPTIISFECIKEEDAIKDINHIDSDMISNLEYYNEILNRIEHNYNNVDVNALTNEPEELDSIESDTYEGPLRLENIMNIDPQIIELGSPQEIAESIKDQNDYISFSNYIINSLLPSNMLNKFIEILNGCNPIIISEISPDSDILSVLKYHDIDLPHTGFLCPIENCSAKLKSVASIKAHLHKTHPDTKYQNQIYNILNKLVASPGEWYVISEAGKIIDVGTQPCLLPSCNHVCRDKDWKLHYQKHHPDLLADFNELGFLWAILHHHTICEDRLPTIYDLTKPREVLCCPYNNCHHYTSNPATHECHLRSHNYPILKNAEAPRIGGKLLFLQEVELNTVLDSFKEEYFKKNSIENGQENLTTEENSIPNPIIITDIQEENDEDITTDNNHKPRQEFRLLRNKSRHPKVRKPFKCTPTERMIQIQDSEKGIKLDKAKKWIEKYQDLEINGFKTINLDIIRRKKISKGLEEKYKGYWVPLWDAFFSIDWTSEEAEIVIDGLTYKTNHLMRKHVSKILGIDTKIKPRAPNTRAIQKENAELLRNIRCKENALFLSNLAEYYSLYTNGREGSTTNNRIGHLETEILKFTSKKDDQWNTNVFGGTSIDDIRLSASDEEVHRLNKLEWITSVIENEEVSKKSRTREEKIKLREKYRDNPKTTLRRSILPSVTPNAKLSANDFADHYGKTWAYKDENFVAASDDTNNRWKLDRSIDKDTTQTIWNNVIDIDKIEETIRHRKHLSAMGPDGISTSILKIFPECGSQLLHRMFKSILRYQRIPSSWKLVRTVMIFKKEDANTASNWRPIGITSTIYRIMTTLLSNAVQDINAEFKIFSPQQKGFIKNTAGCSEHTATLDEMLHEAQRYNAEIHYLTIDFKNAFGSVPHHLFLSIMKQLGLPDLLINLVKNIYDDTHTYIEFNGGRSRLIPWNTGVLQGCPLSPLLFNLCLEPLIRSLHRSEFGYTTPIDNNRNVIKSSVQAYADDVVLIGNSQDDIQDMIDILDHYCEFSRMELAPQKCIGLSNTSQTSPYMFRDAAIPVLSKEDYVNYLGIPISGKTLTKLKALDRKIAECEAKITTILASDITFIQKIHAINTFIYPKFDYHLLNSISSNKKLQLFDRRIRGKLNSITKCPGTPKSFYHLSAKAGGLGLPELSKRAAVLKITTFGKLCTSNDPIIKALMYQWCHNEAAMRGWNRDSNSPFLDLEVTENGKPVQDYNGGTNCLLVQTLKATRRIPVLLHQDNPGTFILDPIDSNTHPPVKITNRKMWTKGLRQVLDALYSKELCSLPFHGHTFNTTNECQTSNAIFKSRNANRSDMLIKFAIRSRTNNLPTPELFAKKPNSEVNPHCKVCEEHGKLCVESLAHRINGCKPMIRHFTYRHNLIQDTICQYLSKLPSKPVIRVNSTLNSDAITLPESLCRLKPDISYYGDNSITMIEITVPYGTIRDNDHGGRSSLDESFDKKLNKYTPLAHYIEQEHGIKTELIPIVVSSLGAIPLCTSRALAKIFTNKRTRQQIEKKISYDALVGSAVIFTRSPARFFGDGRNSIFDENADATQETVETSIRYTSEDETGGSSTEANTNNEEIGQLLEPSAT